MFREYPFLLISLVCLLSLFGYVIYKKTDFFKQQPDQIITYREIDGTALKLHIFNADSDKPRSAYPVLLFFHGGAWQYGDPQQFYPQCRFFSAQGFICISAEYRVYSQHRTDPRASVEDSRYALAYLQQHAQALHIDPANIIVAGGSAGGHLAACLGIPIPLAKQEYTKLMKDRPRALILYNPMIDLSPGKPDHELVADFWSEISPLQHIDNAVPTTLLLLGTKDTEISVATAESFCAAISQQGGHCELALYQGAKHGFFNDNGKQNQYFHATNERVLQFLNKAVNKPPVKL